MKSNILIPSNLRCAGQELRRVFKSRLPDLSTPEFIRAWCCIAYTFPQLHPDDFDAPDTNWPRALRPFAIELWRRVELGELGDEELYPCGPQWAGVFDRDAVCEPDAIAHRLYLAAEHPVLNNEGVIL